MNRFTIYKNNFLYRDTPGYYHRDYTGYRTPGNPDFINHLKNTFGDTPGNDLLRARDTLKDILEKDLGQIRVYWPHPDLTICVVPRSKAVHSYALDQLWFREVVSQAVDKLSRHSRHFAERVPEGSVPDRDVRDAAEEYFLRLKKSLRTEPTFGDFIRDRIKVMGHDLVEKKFERCVYLYSVVRGGYPSDQYEVYDLYFGQDSQRDGDGYYFTDGTDYITRHTSTRTTHLNRSGHGGDGDMPYPGITKATCFISERVRGKNILLIDDIYTRTVNVDEDCIQALLDNGANSVALYTVGKTFYRTFRPKTDYSHPGGDELPF